MMDMIGLIGAVSYLHHRQGSPLPLCQLVNKYIILLGNVVKGEEIKHASENIQFEHYPNDPVSLPFNKMG